MIKNLIQVEINGKKYLPLKELIEDLENHLDNEFKDVAEEDKDGYEWAINDALTHLCNYL